MTITQAMFTAVTERLIPGCEVVCSQPKITYKRSYPPNVRWRSTDEMTATLGDTLIRWYAIDSHLSLSIKWPEGMTSESFTERCQGITRGRLLVFRSFFKWLGDDPYQELDMKPEIAYVPNYGSVAVTFNRTVTTRDTLTKAMTIIAAVHSAA